MGGTTLMLTKPAILDWLGSDADMVKENVNDAMSGYLSVTGIVWGLCLSLRLELPTSGSCNRLVAPTRPVLLPPLPVLM
eukprot:516660-Prymnesium_polylepis.1